MKNADKKYSLATLKRLMGYVKPYGFFLVVSILMSIISVALSLYLPILTGNAVDLIVDEGKVDFSGILRILMIMGICIGVTAFAQWVMNVCNNKMTYCIVRDVRRDAFDKMKRLPLKYMDAHSSGEIVSRIIADVDQFADGLLMGFTQLFTSIMTIIGTLIFMLTLHPGITLVVVGITPVSLFVAAFIAKKTYNMFHL